MLRDLNKKRKKSSSHWWTFLKSARKITTENVTYIEDFCSFFIC